ncbi:MAG: pyridoxal phosphate-dependent aminotransferase [Lachnospiraceae bacterium]|nr:pyridoxal phosphate-dependent aminotransferase [Lachnospiraceae bacterium]
MAERNLDFDAVIERRDTKSLKYDFAVERNMPEDVFPLWVADMDFRTSSYIQDALAALAEHGIFGYSEVKAPYFEAIRGWMKKHHNWDIREEWLIKTPGIVFALAMSVKAFTEVGEGVLIQSPVYYPFFEVIEDNDRRVVSNDLVMGADRRYHIDFDDFERKIVDEHIKLFLLCNPHNPGARVWTKEELERMGDICLKHNVIVVSDEIHQDFTFEGIKHVVFADIKKEFADITITCTSPSKTFNLAAAQISNNFISNKKLRKAFKKQVDAAGYSQCNIMGLVAGEAAYLYGEEWYEKVKAYIWENVKFTEEYVEKYLPGVVMAKQEGTYLVWLDFRETGLEPAEVDRRIVHEAKLWLDSGAIFGHTGLGYQRINVACPRSILEDALDRIRRVITI